MQIRGTDSPTTVHKDTKKKHVVEESAQAAAAQANYGDSTFVTSEDVLTAAADALPTNFLDAPTARTPARKDVDVSVPVHLYEKTDKTTTAGFKKGQPATKTIDGAETPCEVGLFKTGEDVLSIEHFKKK